MKSALLIIDVQQALCEGPDAAFEVGSTIERINLVASKARQARAPVVFVQHGGQDGYLEIGSAGWQLASGLDVRKGDLRLRKTTPDSFHETGLQALLQERDVQQLVICGMHSEFCVDTTARRAMALGFPVVLVEDGHTSAGNIHLTPQQVIAHHNATLSNISSFGPRVRTVKAQDVRFALES